MTFGTSKARLESLSDRSLAVGPCGRYLTSLNLCPAVFKRKLAISAP